MYHMCCELHDLFASDAEDGGLNDPLKFACMIRKKKKILTVFAQYCLLRISLIIAPL